MNSNNTFQNCGDLFSYKTQHSERQKPFGKRDANKLKQDITNGKITHNLCFEDKAIDKQALMEIAQVLQGNTSIQFLGLAKNSIGDDSLSIICSVIRNSFISRIDLSNNSLSYRGILVCLEMIKTNIQITYMCLQGNQSLSDEIYLKLNELLRRNQQIQSEKCKVPLYQALGKEIFNNKLNKNLIYIIFDYFNDATLQEAQTYTKKCMYPEIISSITTLDCNLNDYVDKNQKKEKELIFSKKTKEIRRVDIQMVRKNPTSIENIGSVQTTVSKRM